MLHRSRSSLRVWSTGGMSGGCSGTACLYFCCKGKNSFLAVSYVASCVVLSVVGSKLNGFSGNTLMG